MKGFQDIYTQSVCQDSKVLWPTHMFQDIKKIYLFENDFVFERKPFTGEEGAKEKYIFIPTPVDTNYLLGIYNRKNGVGLFNETLLERELFTSAQIIRIKDETEQHIAEPMLHFLQDKEHNFIQFAKLKLNQARYYYDGIRRIHDSALNKNKLKQFEDELIQTIFQDKKGEAKPFYVDESYFGTIAEGTPLYMTQFRSDVERSFILKGKGASVTSDILDRLAQTAKDKRLNTIVYYCPYYTEEIDCLVIPELKTAIIDSEPPHEVEPLHPNEKVIFIQEKCGEAKELFSQSLELRELEAKYKQLMRQAMLYLQDYRQYKRQEIYQSGSGSKWTHDNLLKLLNGNGA